MVKPKVFVIYTKEKEKGGREMEIFTTEAGKVGKYLKEYGRGRVSSLPIKFTLVQARSDPSRKKHTGAHTSHTHVTH
jgi:hypothetical protein